MCQSRHLIYLTTLKDNEVICHELLLVKGFVEKICHCNIITLQDIKKNKIYQYTLVKNCNNFKFLIQLECGQNQYIINYCSASQRLNLFFEPSNSIYHIQPLYIIHQNHDGHFQTEDEKPNSPVEACKIIELNLKIVQCLFAEKLLESGLTNNLRKTFSLKSKCLIFHSKQSVEKALESDENTLWNDLAFEIINSNLGEDSKIKFVAFLACTRYNGKDLSGDTSYENIKKNTRANPALGGGGLALFGSGYFYSWPTTFEEIIDCFKNYKKIDLSTQLDESNYRRTYGGCFATTLGAIAHEIGHCFDLGHTKEGIMGNGFDYVNLAFVNEDFTENLPDRIVQTESVKDQRLTKIKKGENKFLENYHEQKGGGDCTYFSKNCSIILAHHKWFNLQNESDEKSEITFMKSIIKSSKFNLVLIEIREKVNGLVIQFYELLNRKHKEFEVPEHFTKLERYNIFVITENGDLKLFE
ncbi:uncharacterized protein LOC129618805 [Condylostylus longicornis]|uniref:uncharacterized protein LOC129618805 n=1 Tax=Condylostylus longicornis TaxID=2530218 RepID=UPI00244DFCE6|nr:uncharacterized protein LOC129618805 [Condylostylus longicornis]